MKLSEGVSYPYLARTRREYTLTLHAASPEEAADMAARTPLEEWEVGELEAVEVDE